MIARCAGWGLALAMAACAEDRRLERFPPWLEPCAVAIRDAEDRTRFLGYQVEHFKLWIFVVSAIVAGVAGALYVPQVGIINPSEFAPLNSIEVVIWVAIGGRSTLYGALAGAAIVNYAKTQFTGILPEAWLFVLGAMFVFGTLFLPYGVVGLGRRWAK